ncbi:MAG TPA: shikimate dehydrogenase [Pararhizobium sp.]|nr:shikimate dehydrogenase [Pararhizobium sp.]
MADKQRLPRAFVAGHPIGHSRSPLIHRNWLVEYGIAGTYDPVDVPPQDFAAFIAELKRPDGRYVGGNVTIPHKETAAALADWLDPLAAEIGAANTLWQEEGRLKATNTDVHGFLANLDRGHPNWCIPSRAAVVLGAGGASRAVIAGLVERGYREIRVVNRTHGRARELAHRFGSAVRPHVIEELEEVMEGAGLFVNTTSLGMGGAQAPAIDFTVLHPEATVTDIVYVPLRTPFLRSAERCGLATVDGLGMLLHQAVPGFEKWFGWRPEVSEELRRMVIADMEQFA